MTTARTGPHQRDIPKTVALYQKWTSQPRQAAGPSRPLPIRKLIDFLKEYHIETYLAIATGDCDRGQAIGRVHAIISTGEVLDSPYCLDDEIHDRSHFRQDKFGDHWVYWIGFWHVFMDEPFWPLHVMAKDVIPSAIDIIQNVENP